MSSRGIQNAAALPVQSDGAGTGGLARGRARMDKGMTRRRTDGRPAVGGGRTANTVDERAGELRTGQTEEK